MSSDAPSNNGLVCFTNCLLPQEDGSLIERDLWIDERRGVILDAQRTFYLRRERPDKIIDLQGNILSPGFLDIQINGAYGFDFSVYNGDGAAYRAGLKQVGERIVETGVTSLVPTIITQEESLYPVLLSLLRPYTPAGGAHLLGWHAEGPFLQHEKRGAHAVPFLRAAPRGWASIERVYGEANLLVHEDWEMACGDGVGGAGSSGAVRIVTAAPEVEGMMGAVAELVRRGIVVSIGHSTASSDVATSAVQRGARLITHLFNAMPQLHHRDPSIIGLLGASPHLSPLPAERTAPRGTGPASSLAPLAGAPPAMEVLDECSTPPQTPRLRPVPTRTASRPELHLEKGAVADMEFERPFYGLIVDGIHSHPNSVRLAYTAHREGCILITDAMHLLAPDLRDGVHDWRDGRRFVKEGLKLYIEGTDTLAGSVVTMDMCVRNFSRFTGCSLGEAIKCATFNPARCLNIEGRKGTLRAGADADLVVLDRQGRVISTWVDGKEVWTRAAPTNVVPDPKFVD